MGIVAGVLSAAGSVLGAVGSYNQGKAQAKQIRSQAKLDIETLRNQTEELKGVQTTTMAANGVYSNSGVYADILTDTAYKERLDELAIEEAANAQAKAARKAGTMGAVGSLLGGASQIANSWNAWKRTSKGAA
jgi:hypothetical protein